MNDLYHNGHPCAIKATTEEGRSEKWLSVMYHDDDGGIVWNPYSSERFTAELHAVSKICRFDINE